MAVQTANFPQAFRVLLLCLAISAVVAAPQPALADIQIGVVAPLSGPVALYGQWIREASEDAVVAINRAGGINGERFALHFYDDQCTPAVAIGVAQRVARDNLIAVVGHCPSVAGAVRPFYENAGIPLIVPNASLRDLGGPSSGSVFHLGARADRLGEAAVQLMQQENAGRRIGVLTDGSAAGTELASELRRRSNVVFELSVQDTGAPQLASRVSQTDADTIFVAAIEPDRAVSHLQVLPPSIRIYLAGLPTARVESWERFWALMGSDASRVRVVAPRAAVAAQNIAADALAGWRNRSDRERMRRREPPAAYSATLAAFELLYGQLTQIAQGRPLTKQAPGIRAELVVAMRARTQPTVLGPLRSGETGELQIAYSVHASSQVWTPAGSQPRGESAKPAPPPPAPSPAPSPIPPPVVVAPPSPPPPAPKPAPAPAPRVEVKVQLKPGIYWNSWIQSDGKEQKSLDAGGKPYDFALDLSRYKYLIELSADSGTALAGEIRKARALGQKQIKLIVRPLIAGTALRWGDDMPQEVPPVFVDVDKLSPPSEDQLVEDSAEFTAYLAGARTLAHISDRFHAARIRFPVVADSKGCAQIAVSIWDATGTRPLDNVVHTVSVAEQDACGIGEYAALSAGFSTLLEAVPHPMSPPSAPNAALHVFDLPRTNGSHRGVAVFVDATPLQRNQPLAVYSWRLETTFGKYISDPDLLLKLIVEARKTGNYSTVAKELGKKVFSTPTGDDAANALAALQRIAKDATADPLVFVRVTSAERTPVYLPLALLSSANASLLARPLRVVHPASEPSAAFGQQCVDPWTFVIPRELHKFQGEILLGLDKDWAAKSRQSTILETLEYLNPKPPPPMSAAPPANGEGLLMLAHHAKGHLWFDKDTDRIGITDLKRDFRPGSVAILTACSAANPDGDNDQWVQKIGSRGVDTIFASPFPVPLDYGVHLTRNFVEAVRTAGAGRPTIVSLFDAASDKAAKGGSVSEDIRKEFVLIGDPEIRLCK